MTVYVDKDFCCHVTDDGTMTTVETDFFDGKCDAYIEGYRLIPAGESWTREDGVVFHGEMIAPWRDFRELDAAQRQYERELMSAMAAELADAQAALEMLEGTPDEEVE